MTDWLLTTVNHYLHIIPLEVFAFVASFIEEIIPPIPAAPIMLSIGGAAKLQGHELLFILLLAILSAFGKTLGSIIVYHLIDKLEDVFVARFGGFFNLKPGELEAFGAKLGHGARDYIVLTFIRSFPLIPSALVTVGAGILRIPLRLFIFATFFGTIVRDGFYLYAGYVGAQLVLTYLSDSEHITKAIEIGTLLAVIIYLIVRHRKSQQSATTDKTPV